VCSPVPTPRGTLHPFCLFYRYNHGSRLCLQFFWKIVFFPFIPPSPRISLVRNFFPAAERLPCANPLFSPLLLPASVQANFFLLRGLSLRSIKNWTGPPGLTRNAQSRSQFPQKLKQSPRASCFIPYPLNSSPSPGDFLVRILCRGRCPVRRFFPGRVGPCAFSLPWTWFFAYALPPLQRCRERPLPIRFWEAAFLSVAGFWIPTCYSFRDSSPPSCLIPANEVAQSPPIVLSVFPLGILSFVLASTHGPFVRRGHLVSEFLLFFQADSSVHPTLHLFFRTPDESEAFFLFLSCPPVFDPFSGSSLPFS